MDMFINDCRKLVYSLVVLEPRIGVFAYLDLLSKGKIDHSEAALQVKLLQHELSNNGDGSLDEGIENLIKSNKYYQNLYGELHKTDRKVMIKLVETNFEAELSKETLELYKDTKKELLLCEDYYRNIVDSNLDMIDYIHGCMYPVNPVEAYFAKTGQILNYNSNFIEEQEDTLIETLNKYTTDFLGVGLSRHYVYHNPFYVHSYLFIMRNNLLPVCIGERLSKMNTMYACKFLVATKFRSTLDIWDEIQNFNNKTLWWVYANIDHYIAHMGTNETFDMLLHNVLGENSIGIGTYRCIQRDPVASGEQYNPSVSPYTNKPIVANTSRLNKAYNANEDTDVDLNVLNAELVKMTSIGNNEEDEYKVRKSTDFVLSNFTGPVDTKVAEISTLENFTSYNVDVFKIILDYWAYFLNNDLYGSFTKNIPTVIVEYQDPNTLTQYNIDSKIGFLIAMKILLHASGKSVLEKGLFTISNVLNWKIPLRDVMDKSIFKDGYTDLLYSTIQSILPSEMRATSSVSEVSQYLNTVIDFFKKYWLLTSNVENQIVSANMYRIIHVLTLQEEAYFKKSVAEVDIDRLLEEHGIKFNIAGNYNHILALNELFKSCLGIEANSDIKLKDLLDSYKSFIRKMKSYTIEVTGSIKSENKNDVCYQHLGLLFSRNGMLKLYPDKVKAMPLEEEFYNTGFESYDPKDKCKAFHYLDKMEVEMENDQNVAFYLGTDEVEILPQGVEIELLKDIQ